MKKKILIKTLGPLTLYYNNQKVKLPASKKTRALLAYLSISAKSHLRERLCEYFWEMPEDPRASLRWSLSKLRGTLKANDLTPIIADRETAKINSEVIDNDFLLLRKKMFDEKTILSLPELRKVASALEETLLDGMDLPDQHSFQSWLIAQREDAKLCRLNAMRRITFHPDVEHHEASIWARRWLELDPFNANAAEARVMTLCRMGEFDKARQLTIDFSSSLTNAGMKTSVDFEKHFQSDSYRNADTFRKKLSRKQTIKFCEVEDNVRIAYATVGSGPPILKAANWLNHLELDWESPLWGDLFQSLASQRTFIRYDERGNGLSDWNVNDISQAAFVKDLEAVVTELDLKKFPLLGISQGCAVAVEYAVRHPENVSALILISGYASGWRIGASAEERAHREAVMTLTRHGWGSSNPAYRHIFSQTFMPDAGPDVLDWFDEFQRQTTSPENAVRFQQAFAEIDVRQQLAKINVPTIVFHSKFDQRITLEQGRELANGIPNARFVPLESNNHILLGHESALQICASEIQKFLVDNGI